MPGNPLLLTAFLSGLLLGAGSVQADPADTPPAAIFQKYCFTCHNQRAKRGGLTLDTLDLGNVPAAAAVWEKVAHRLRTGTMPPAGMPRPDRTVGRGVAAWLETTLDRAAAARPDPGRTETFHRLNRVEYQNAVRDLLALEIDGSSLLPADDLSYGFDNIAGVLKMSPVLMERYTAAAQKISRTAVGSLRIPATQETFRPPPDLAQDFHFEGMPFGTRGGMKVRYNFPLDAEYVLKVRVSRDYLDTLMSFTEPHQIEVSVDGERVGLFGIGDTQAPRNGATTGGGLVNRFYNPPNQKADAGFEARVPIQAGPREVAVAFQMKTRALVETLLEPNIRPLAGAFADTRYEPYIGSLAIGGPYGATGSGDTPSRRHIFVCRPAKPSKERDCAEKILSTMGRRAYRRPLTKEDRQVLLGFYDRGRRAGDFDAGIEMALRRLLVSPEFLFRIHPDPDKVKPGTVYRVADVELASRLSFFLWRSIPDDELLDLATRGKLKDPAVLERQVKRMLADGRSQALVTNFTGQWLFLRNLPALQPDAELFPDFDDGLRQAFRREAELLFDTILRENRSALELLTADYTFVNERLARHYGIPGVYGSRFRRVAPKDGTRGGILSLGSILTATSYANRTSPVLRGKWILESLLDTPPPPPPANVPPLREASGKPLSVRERLEEHRENPACSSCHQLMDPLGFALENYDAVGQWRTKNETGSPIDASGALLDGTRVDSPAALRDALIARPDAFVNTLTRRLLTYALGRGVEYYDAPAVRGIARDAAANNYSLSSLILGVIKSAPFQMRRTPS